MTRRWSRTLPAGWVRRWSVSTSPIFPHHTASPSVAGNPSDGRVHRDEKAAGRPVGVLALQGDFREHIAVLKSLGADAVGVRRPSELAELSGLIIPGGESSVMDKLSRMFGLAEPLTNAIADGLPVWGTC